MKKSGILFLLLLFVVAASYSCSNQSKRSRKPVSTISILPTAKNYSFGSSISVKVETKLRNGEIDHIKLFHNNELVKESKDLSFTIEGLKLEKLGNNNFHVVAT